MTFNEKINCVLEKLTPIDNFANYIVNDYLSAIPIDVIYSIKCNIERNNINYNYTYCDSLDNSMYEFSYYDKLDFSDMIIAKHKPVYDNKNKYIGRELNYLLRINLKDNDKSNCIVYYKDDNYVYKKEYDVITYYLKDKNMINELPVSKRVLKNNIF